MEQSRHALGLSAADTNDVLCPNSNNQRDMGWDGNEAEIMITNEEGGDDESWILTGGVVQGPPQAQQMVAPTIARANVRQGLATAQNVGTLKDGYIQRAPLPRVPQIQSTSPVACATIHRNPTHTGYLPIVRIPTWSDMIGSLSGVGRCIERYVPPYSPVRLI
jgi:hypothetical protein